MTLAVVVATEMIVTGATPAPTAELTVREDGDTTTVLDRLLGQLDALERDSPPWLRSAAPHGERLVITRPELAPVLRKHGHEVIESDGLADDLTEIARIARAAKEPLLIVHGDVVAHDEVITRMMLDGDAPAIVATVPLGPSTDPRQVPLRTSKGLVTSAGSSYHQVTEPNAAFGGILRVTAQQTKVLAGIAEKLATLLQMPGGLTLDAAEGDSATIHDDAPSLLVVGLVRSGVKTAHRSMTPLVCERVFDAEQAAAADHALDLVDEDRVLLDAAVKSDDGFFTTYAVSTYSRFIARWSAKRGLTPNAVTSISMGISVLAAVWFGAGNRAGMVIGGVLLYFAFVFDCVDGQLARYTRRFSTLGAWLDATFDRAKEYVVYAGLAAGSTAAVASSSVHSGDVWALAIAAMMVQSLRHYVDFAFGAAKRRSAPKPLSVTPLSDRDDGIVASTVSRPPRPRRGGGLGHLAIWLSEATEKMPFLRWTKKILVLPIGERFALISITAALFNARVTFLVLLVWGGIAALYTLTGRVLRSLTQPAAAATGAVPAEPAAAAPAAQGVGSERSICS